MNGPICNSKEKVKTIDWDRDATPYPKKGQQLRDGRWQLWKVLKMDRKAMQVTLEKMEG